MQAEQFLREADGGSSSPLFQSSLYRHPSPSTDPLPTVNAAYRRSHGAAYAVPFESTVQQPSLPATLRQQFQSLTEGDVASWQRRLEREEAAAARDSLITQRAARVAAARRSEAQCRGDRARQQAQRQAHAAANAETLRIQKDYNSLCRW